MDQKIMAFLESLEGLRLHAYPDSKGLPTIGIGNTYYEDGKPVKMGDVITRERAYSLAKYVLPTYTNAVNKAVKVPLTENQFIALVALCYNIGTTAFAKFSLIVMINSGKFSKDQIYNRWITNFLTSGGKFVQGLLNRRHKEADKYFSV